jgi:hypothetical protein
MAGKLIRPVFVGSWNAMVTQLIDPMPDDAVTGKVGAGTDRADSRQNRRAAL